MTSRIYADRSETGWRSQASLRRRTVSRRRTARSTTVCSRCVSTAERSGWRASKSSAFPKIPVSGLFISWRKISPMSPGYSAHGGPRTDSDASIQRKRRSIRLAARGTKSPIRETNSTCPSATSRVTSQLRSAGATNTTGAFSEKWRSGSVSGFMPINSSSSNIAAGDDRSHISRNSESVEAMRTGLVLA